MIKLKNTGRGFASDNNAGVHPKILEAINSANVGHVIAYGDDPYTDAAVEKFREHFGEDVDVYFVFGGTGANVLGLKAITEPYNAIICAKMAHINVDECGAPEDFTGCKLLSVPTEHGKVDVESIKPFLGGVEDQHHVQRRVISISQSTEMGTVYTANELRALANFAHEENMLLHMDGARIANAAVSLGAELRDITTDVGVDILSFGGTKNGLMYGEAIVFFDRQLSRDFKYIRKQGTHLASKMRFISAQFEALLSNNLWRENAERANLMAQNLEGQLKKINISITRKVQANAVFAQIATKYVRALQEEFFFYPWSEDGETSEIRLMTSFDTTEEDIHKLVDLMKKTIR
jgi:threonine aldolase